MRSRGGRAKRSSSASRLKRRNKRAGHLPWHKKPKLVEVRSLGNRTYLWVFRPRCQGGNEMSKRWQFKREKDEWKAAIAKFLQAYPDADSLRHKRPVTLCARYSEPSALRDPSNIDAGSMKAILDALVTHGILPDDNWAWIKPPYSYTWELDRHDPRVELTIREL